MNEGFLERIEEGSELLLAGRGRWTLAAAAGLDRELAGLRRPASGQAVRFDMSGIEALDTTGALLLARTQRRLQAEGFAVEIGGLGEGHRGLLEEVARHQKKPVPPRPERNVIVFVMAEIGEAVLEFLDQARQFVGFMGLVTQTLVLSLLRPTRLRFTAIVHHLEEVGFNALPIVGLLSFLIGVVMAYQGASQLRQFGAEIFVVDLIAISVLRELGVLLTAIVIAGRSGSAFTAQIGSMKLREEIDAMRTLGINPVEALVLPRLIALLIALPLLAFFANVMGLIGGALMAWIELGISVNLFIERLSAINYWHYVTGMVKSPFFAALIAIVGCHQGMQVEGSAESVGHRTTRSVVESIFLVILADAFFSILFNILKV
ncbi:MAG: MlaE family lipid ABC transporter permease subunit [Alphaproteobacteria bacterium]|nr:MlaE family lipid ABC transporter permease subunit [Alphaproteobacteria bacterium]